MMITFLSISYWFYLKALKWCVNYRHISQLSIEYLMLTVEYIKNWSHFSTVTLFSIVCLVLLININRNPIFNFLSFNSIRHTTHWKYVTQFTINLELHSHPVKTQIIIINWIELLILRYLLPLFFLCITNLLNSLLTTKT